MKIKKLFLLNICNIAFNSNQYFKSFYNLNKKLNINITKKQKLIGVSFLSVSFSYLFWKKLNKKVEYIKSNLFNENKTYQLDQKNKKIQKVNEQFSFIKKQFYTDKKGEMIERFLQKKFKISCYLFKKITPILPDLIEDFGNLSINIYSKNMNALNIFIILKNEEDIYSIFEKYKLNISKRQSLPFKICLSFKKINEILSS